MMSNVADEVDQFRRKVGKDVSRVLEEKNMVGSQFKAAQLSQFLNDQIPKIAKGNMQKRTSAPVNAGYQILPNGSIALVPAEPPHLQNLMDNFQGAMQFQMQQMDEGFRRRRRTAAARSRASVKMSAATGSGPEPPRDDDDKPERAESLEKLLKQARKEQADAA